MPLNTSSLPNITWRKKGKIFDPANHDLPLGCEVFAQGPQALKTKNGWRVYFSSRVPDKEMYLSNVCFAEYDPTFTTLHRISTDIIIPLGEPGCFDEHGIFPFHITQVDDQVFGYTSGWSRRDSVPVDTAIGLAISNDNGDTFARYGNGPVLAASPHEPFLVGDPFVKKIDDQFHMWYIFGTHWNQPIKGTVPDRVYKIGHAISADGIVWARNHDGEQIIGNVLGTDECQAYPTIVQIGTGYWMVFCYRYANDFRTNIDRGYRLGAAYSEDLKHWHRADDKLKFAGSDEDPWDLNMMCYPNIAQNEDGIWLLYNGNAFGRDGFGVAKLEE